MEFPGLEPGVFDTVTGAYETREMIHLAAALSQALSLKRIADALEKLVPAPAVEPNWIEWTPTEERPAPVLPPGMTVLFKTRAGWVSEVSALVDVLEWAHTGNTGDIVAYAIAT